MINTYIINMEKDVEKRESILTRLSSYNGLKVNVFSAVVGKDLSNTELTKFTAQEFRDKATITEIGCALSHNAVYKHIIQQNVPYALILEDDTYFTPPHQFPIDKITACLMEDKPMVILLTTGFDYNLRNKVSDVDECFKLYSLESSWCAAGYIINQSAAKLLADQQLPIRFVADNWTAFVNQFGLHLYGVVPRLVSWPDGLGEVGTSVYESHKHNIKYKMKQRLIGWISKFLHKVKYLRGWRTSYKWRNCPPVLYLERTQF